MTLDTLAPASRVLEYSAMDGGVFERLFALAFLTLWGNYELILELVELRLKKI